MRIHNTISQNMSGRAKSMEKYTKINMSNNSF